jgi:DNA-binding transcriptional LysR family regulator
MHRIHSKRFDLNLLKTLAVLIEERQVSRAALRLNLTQSAVSHALQRLREQFDDPLLVRRGQEMVPTARAEVLMRSLDDVLGAIDRMVGPVDFDPREASGTVRIATTDYGSSIILPHVVHDLAAAAPKLTVAYTDLSESTFEQLKSGFIDLALSGQESTRDMQSEPLFTERFVVMARAGHPCAHNPMTLDDYTRWPHVVVDLVHSRLLSIDRVLKRLGRKRTIGVRLPHFLSAPFLAQHSDLLVPVPERLAAMYAVTLGLRVLEPPPEIDIGRFEYVQMWDARRSGDPTHRWLRALIRVSVRHLAAESDAVTVN